jgi:hypothetical protein
MKAKLLDMLATRDRAEEERLREPQAPAVQREKVAAA